MRKNKGKHIIAMVILTTLVSSNVSIASSVRSAGSGRASIVRFDQGDKKTKGTPKTDVIKEATEEEIEEKIEKAALKKNKPIAKDLSKTNFGKRVKIKKSLYAPIVPSKGVRVSSPFGNRIHPIYKTKKMHWGIDIAAASGTFIHAIADGEVILARPNGGAGNEVKIKHTNGVESRYLHMSKRAIKKGDKVEAGQVIGTVGSTGFSTGPHLHFEVKVDGKTIDPSQLFSK